jgi:hypothetical protein
MSTPFAIASDLEEMWRALTPEEAGVATARLAQASRIIRAQFPTIDDRIAAGTLEVELVRDVAVDMVLRYMRNPDGKSMEMVEDYSYQRTAADTGGSVYMTPAEIDILTPSTSRSGAFSITPSDPDPTAYDVATARFYSAVWHS